MKALAFVLLVSSAAMAQGTEGILRCAFRGELNLHQARATGSPVLARVKCGDAVLLIDQRFGSAHIRTEDGKDGFLIGLGLGQWWVESADVSAAAISPAPLMAPAPVISVPRQTAEPRGADEFFRRFDVDVLAFSYNRQGLVDFFGGGTAFTTNVTEHVGFVADFSWHRTFDAPTQSILAYRFGPRFTFPRFGPVTAFSEIMAGGMRFSVSISGSGNVSIQDHINGFAAMAGGGLDIHVKPWLALRAIHADYSYMHLAGGHSQGLRIGAGPVFRFGR